MIKYCFRNLRMTITIIRTVLLTWLYYRFLSGGCNETKYPAGIYLFKLNNGSIRTLREISSKLPIKTTKQRNWHRPGIFIVDFEQVNAGWVIIKTWTGRYFSMRQKNGDLDVDIKYCHFQRYHKTRKISCLGWI